MSQTQQLQQQVIELQSQLAQCELLHAKAVKEHQIQTGNLR